MNKEKALKMLVLNIENTKSQIDDANDVGAYQSASYLNGRLEALEGIKRSIESGNWD